MKKTLAGLFFVTCSLFGLTLEETNTIIENEKIPWIEQIYICEREVTYIKKDAKECLKAAEMLLANGKNDPVVNALFDGFSRNIEEQVGEFFFHAGAFYGSNGDYQNELKMYEKAIKYKAPRAFYNLGVIYYNGFGVSKNHIKAYEYFKEALKLGYPDAQAAIQTLCSQNPWACK